jgi:DNA-binding transcriptional LysR family regulator
MELIMALRPVFDLDLLRTLVTIAEEASFTRAADRVGRTQSAVTLQVQRLESLVGHPLLTRSKGGPVELTPQGRVLVDHARALLKMNDDAFAALSAEDLPLSLRVGVSAYYTPLYLRRLSDAMREIYPNVLLEVTQGRSCQLAPQIKEGAFDLVVCEGGVEPRDLPVTEVWRAPLRWITSTTEEIHRRDPLPLSLWPSNCPWRPRWMDDCFWRSATLRALHQADRAYRIAAVSDTIEAHFQAVLDGKAVMVSPGIMLPPGVRPVDEGEGLPPLPDTRIIILKSANAAQPLTDRVVELIQAAVDAR